MLYYVVVQECIDSPVTTYEFKNLEDITLLYKSTVAKFGLFMVFFATYGEKLELTFKRGA